MDRTDSQNLTQPNDRRRAFRLKLNLPMKSQGSPGRILNISKTGMRYLIPGAVSPGAQLDFSLQFQNGTKECQGEVVWVQKLGVSSVVGVRFQDESDNTRRLAEQIDDIINATQTFFEQSTVGTSQQ